MIAVVVPALDRPERVAPLAESLAAAARVPTSLLYITSPADAATREACRAAGVRYVTTPFPLAGGDYARKVNYGITLTDEPWIFQASDDLAFQPGWDEEALRRGEPERFGVVGTNDLGNPIVRNGRHATHSLLRRSYVVERGTADEPGKALHEGYWHCWVDNELVETAVARRAWVSARRSYVEHLHPIWPARGGGRKGVDDATYRRGQLRYREDNALFHERRPLWRSVRPRPL